MRNIYNIIEYMTGALFNIIFIMLAVAAVYLVSTQAFAYGMNIFSKDMDVPLETISVEIPEGDVPGRADALAVGRILEEAGLTNNAWVFFIESRLNGTYKEFRPGTYEFTTHMDDGYIMQQMQRARFAEVVELQISIPEGLTLRQIGDLCEARGLFTAEEFLEAAAAYDRLFHFLEPVLWRENPLEGYLFPDTYRLPSNPHPNDLITRMLERFDNVFDYEMEERAEELGLTIDQVIIKASIIEKEIRVPSERALCSSIIYNRLKRGQMLEMCSTVLYVLDTPKSRLLYSDLNVQSPYNTYRNYGLPVGPISNPGRAAIMAALYPADTDYLFMVVKDENAGEHFFSSNFADHDAAKRQFNQPDWLP